MAIDLGTLTEKIDTFRSYTQKNAINPEMLGGLLQQIADVLATAGTEVNVESVNLWRSKLKDAIAICSLSQGKTDRNNVYASYEKVDIYTGTKTQVTDELFIQQATTERAGVMCAQQVTDLNSLNTAVNSTILPLLETIKEQIAALQKAQSATDTSTKAATCFPHIFCEVVGNELYIRGAKEIQEEGYVPYLFRFTRKHNYFRYYNEHSVTKKGWHLFGSQNSLMIDENEMLLISNKVHHEFNEPTKSYTTSPKQLVCYQINDEDGSISVAYGRSMISSLCRSGKALRMIRLPFAIGFARPRTKSTTVKSGELVTNLATFSVIYMPDTQVWCFSK